MVEWSSLQNGVCEGTKVVSLDLMIHDWEETNDSSEHLVQHRALSKSVSF